MEGAVDWSILYLMVGIVASGAVVSGTLIGITWNMRGMIANIETRIGTKISDTEAAIVQRIVTTRGEIRNELQPLFLRVEDSINSVEDKLDLHRVDDATMFRAIGERVAKLEANNKRT